MDPLSFVEVENYELRDNEILELDNNLINILKNKPKDYLEENHIDTFIEIYKEGLQYKGNNFHNFYNKLKKDFDGINDDLSPSNYKDRVDILILELTEKYNDDKNSKLRENIIEIRSKKMGEKVHKQDKIVSRKKEKKEEINQILSGMGNLIGKKLNNKQKNKFTEIMEGGLLNILIQIIGIFSKDVFKRYAKTYLLFILLWNILTYFLLRFIGFM